MMREPSVASSAPTDLKNGILTNSPVHFGMPHLGDISISALRPLSFVHLETHNNIKGFKADITGYQHDDERKGERAAGARGYDSSGRTTFNRIPGEEETVYLLTKYLQIPTAWRTV
ncbi:hypothetical protein AJ80_05988 [Polytolypa hystricis UAMH7299]|uniref:Uncharacterized protein n=1 Tax=Polytolypa hystricis (strain UAMH7299) TaxID=1447883 RepID=A0A2B7Y0B4_POLH7|nr:hypothetical protein AJ80_05988 [Polytolypa hystricis UAMH7299]